MLEIKSWQNLWICRVKSAPKQTQRDQVGEAQVAAALSQNLEMTLLIRVNEMSSESFAVF